MKLKHDSWLGYSASTNDDDARRHAARRLECGVDEVEIERDGGAVLVRRRKDADVSRDE